jgi:hypothetical protein
MPGTILAGALAFAILATPAFGQAAPKKFYADDPLLREPRPHPVQKVAHRDVDDLYDFLENSFVTPRRETRGGKYAPHPALDVNTLGEVPDNAWYTSRHYYRRMSLEELKRGPGDSTPPAKGTWRLIAAKTNGVTPGFVIEDERKNRYVLKLDPPDFPELASSADVIGSKALYALGYNTPENYIVHFRRENLEIGEGVQWRGTGGKKQPLTARILDAMFKPQPKDSEGFYRGVASRYIAGELVGPFKYAGMRTDDPNDTIPHENRRMLRGLNVFAAWLNHHDTKAVNTIDSVVNEDGLRYLKHYLLDFGDILGSDGVHPKYAWSGNEYTIDTRASLVGMVTFGFNVPRWARADYPKIRGVGLVDFRSFDPIAWKPNYPNPAFLMMDSADAFWAAKQVASFTDDEIRALVETGEYTDPRAADWITECLIKRRDKIADAWFSRVLPLDKFRVVDGKLAFEDLGQSSDAGASREYSVQWASYDNSGAATALTGAAGRQVPPLRAGTEYLAATIGCAGPSDSCPGPLTVYLRPRGSALEVVWVDR